MAFVLCPIHCKGCGRGWRWRCCFLCLLLLLLELDFQLIGWVVANCTLLRFRNKLVPSSVRPSVFPCQVGVVKLERSRPTTSGRLDTLDGHYYYYKCRDEIKAKQMNIEGTEMVAALLGHQWQQMMLPPLFYIRFPLHFISSLISVTGLAIGQLKQTSWNSSSNVLYGSSSCSVFVALITLWKVAI